LDDLDEIRDARVAEGLRDRCGLLGGGMVGGPAAKNDDATYLDRAKVIDSHTGGHELRRDVIRGRLDCERRDRGKRECDHNRCCACLQVICSHASYKSIAHARTLPLIYQ
jgi:hypothetical protein